MVILDEYLPQNRIKIIDEEIAEIKCKLESTTEEQYREIMNNRLSFLEKERRYYESRIK